MQQYKIDPNIPVPKIAQGGGRPKKYPFAAMIVGDSFFAPTVNRQALATAARRFAIHGEKFLIRTATENEVRGSRIWRIA